MAQNFKVLPPGSCIQTNIPQRLDRLPWSFWHWRIITTLGITWILDGLEVTIVSALSGVLIEPDTLHLSETQIGASASAYLLGAILGSLLFGRLTDRFGRKKLFLVTLTIYLLGTLATAFSWNFYSFSCFRALTGTGIGGEGSAMSSAIDELLPARFRGRVGISLNGSYWLGTLLGAALSLLLLNESVLPHSIGWRACFGLGSLLGSVILFLRRNLPESPRWLILHGRISEADAVMKQIEEQIEKQIGKPLSTVKMSQSLLVRGTVHYQYIIKSILGRYRRRAILGLSLVITQAFAYNAIFFTYALILGRFYGVKSDKVGFFLIPFAIGNWLGPLILGPLFDTIGRKVMIAITYGISGVLLAFTGYIFAQGWLTAISQTVLWCVVFFVASAAASAAYLTVSELFPVEMRGLAIALFYSVGTAVGGVAAPTIFGALIESGSRQSIFYGYLMGAVLMLLGSLVAVIFGVSAEGKSLEALSNFGDETVL